MTKSHATQLITRVTETNLFNFFKEFGNPFYTSTTTFL